ncbi:MAG: BREX-3 system phosphatase PglZ [Caldilinea sp.]
MTPSWRDALLQKLTPGLARLTLAFDPDGLLLEAGLAAHLRARGFELIVYEDSLAFHYTFESTVRARWDAGETIEAIVVVPADDSVLPQLPYPLVEEGRVVAAGLADLFPALSYRSAAGLDPSDLDLLWKAVTTLRPAPMGDDATADFILRHVFGIAVETVKAPSDLLRILLRRHYNNQRVPCQLDAYLCARLHTIDRFDDWPLAQLLPDRAAFLAFLQQRWPEYLRQSTGAQVVATKEAAIPYTTLPGPAQLPFDHNDVRVYIDTLFLEGLLQAVEVEDAAQVRTAWAAVGVRFDPASDRRRRLVQLAKIVEETLPAEDARHDAWLSFAPRWAELSALYFSAAPSEEEQTSWQRLFARVDERFLDWLALRYATLHNQPAHPPVMVHHIPRVMARRLQDAPGSRLALIVVDGLALDQWHTVRRVLQEQRQGVLREDALFAWIPTLTPVSRQAIFAGQPPYFFGNSIHTTEREPHLWARFWAEHGVAKDAVGYRKGLGMGDPGVIAELSSNPRMQVLGLVIDAVDSAVHGMTLGAAGMHTIVRQWTEGGYLAAALSTLYDAGFAIWLTADHGNVEAVGMGRPIEQALADVRGERVRVYPTAALCAATQARFEDSLDWPPVGLPTGYYPLLAQGYRAFVQKGETIMAHGGAAIAEVIVPLVTIGQE